MKVISTVAAKGGVGKTTISANIAAAMTRANDHVVLIDLDPQNAVAFHLNLGERGHYGVANALLDGRSLSDVCVRGPSGLVVAPFGHISEAQRTSLESRFQADHRLLARHLQALNLPDDAVVILDTPPGPSAYLSEALTAANFVIVVSLADAGSYATLPITTQLIHTYCDDREGYIDFGLILNQVDRSKQLNKDVARVMQSSFDGHVIGVIHQDQSVAESLGFQKSVLEYAPCAQASVEIERCAERLAKVLGVAEVEV